MSPPGKRERRPTLAGGSGADFRAGALETRSSYQNPASAATALRVEMLRDGAQFIVRTPDPSLNASFAVKAAAWGYAIGIRTVRGWPACDLTGDRHD